MIPIQAITTLLLFQLGGEWLQSSFNLIVPGPVIGMFGLFAYLLLTGPPTEELIKTSQALIAALPLLFLAPTVGLAFLGADFQSDWIPWLGACVIATVICYPVVAHLLTLLLRRFGNNA